MDIDKMISDYALWLKNEIHPSKAGQYYELTTPYLDRYNDHLQIYVKQNPDGMYEITDDGYIIQNLKSSGVVFKKSGKRTDILNRILNNYGISNTHNRLTVAASESDYPVKKHMLLQAMMTIDDMFIAEPGTVKNLFAEDVGAFLDEQGIFYSRDFSIVGKTGGTYTYEYHLQRTATSPERFCKTVNSLRRSSRNLVIFNWLDTVDKRRDEGKLIVFINDESEVKVEDINAFRVYDISTVKWSERMSHLDLIAN